MPKKLTAPANLADLLKRPEAIQEAFDLLNALAALKVSFEIRTQATALGQNVPQIRGEPPNLFLPLPIKLDAPIADASASTASLTAQLNLLLAALRRAQILPTA